jgi:small subunit ribosomal protein S2
VIEARQGRAADRGIDLGAMEEAPVEYALEAPVEAAPEAEVVAEA